MALPVISTPKYEIKLPSDGSKISFRPFLVKEEKILLLASESENTEDVIHALKDVVLSCTYDKVNLHEHCLADMQWLFLQIRGKSVGEEIDLYLVCGECQAKQPYTLNVADFEVVNPGLSKTIALDAATKVEMRYPTLEHYAALFETDAEETLYAVVADCITKVYNEDEMFVNDGNSQTELLEFIDNLTPEQFAPFEGFYKNMPVLRKQIEFTCKSCNKDNDLVVDGINHFFG